MFNLAVPNSMLFHGDIDATTGPVPGSPLPGDFWLNNTTGNVLLSWPDIGGQPINQDQFIYYSQDSPTTFKWNLGSIQNNQGFVTINTNQDVNGSKTFTNVTYFDNDVTVRLNKPTLLTGTLTVDGSTLLNSDVTVANNKSTTLGGLLQVKDVATFNADVIAEHNVTVGTNCLDLLLIKSSAKFECGLEIGDSSNPCSTPPFNIYAFTDIHLRRPSTQRLNS